MSTEADKVRALRRLAASTRGPESETALARANALIVRHGLSEDELVDAAPAPLPPERRDPGQLMLSGLGEATALARVEPAGAPAVRAPSSTETAVLPGFYRATREIARPRAQKPAATKPPSVPVTRPPKGPCGRCGKKVKRRLDGEPLAHECPHRRSCQAFCGSSACALCDHERDGRLRETRERVLRAMVREACDNVVRLIAAFYRSCDDRLGTQANEEQELVLDLLWGCAAATHGVSPPLRTKLARERYAARMLAAGFGEEAQKQRAPERA